MAVIRGETLVTMPIMAVGDVYLCAHTCGFWFSFYGQRYWAENGLRWWWKRASGDWVAL